MTSTRNPGRVVGFLYLLLSIAGPIKPKSRSCVTSFEPRAGADAPRVQNFSPSQRISNALKFLEGYKRVELLEAETEIPAKSTP